MNSTPITAPRWRRFVPKFLRSQVDRTTRPAAILRGNAANVTTQVLAMRDDLDRMAATLDALDARTATR